MPKERGAVGTASPQKLWSAQFLVMLWLGVGAISLYLVFDVDGLRLPYLLVKASFAYANDHAHAEFGAFGRRTLVLVEALAVAWWAAVSLLSFGAAEGEESTPLYVLLWMLGTEALAALPLIPFVWVFLAS
jgi:hypothetical protein